MTGKEEGVEKPEKVDQEPSLEGENRSWDKEVPHGWKVCREGNYGRR